MIHIIQNKLASILESEMSEGGRLESLSSVHLGEFRLLVNEDYPAAFVLTGELDVGGSPQKVDIELDYVIQIFTIGASIQESAENIGDLVWDENEAEISIGAIPVLLKNLSFKVNNHLYRVKVGKARVIQGQDANRRYSTAVEIPVKIKTIRTLN